MSRCQRLYPTGARRGRLAPLPAWLARVCIVAALLSLGACSSTTFLYNRLHIILPWYLGRYVDLERDQKDYLDELLAPFLAWHRGEELGSYVAVIENLEAGLDRELTAADVAAISRQFEQAWFRVEARALDWLLDLGEQLSDEQIEQFIDTLREKQRDHEEEYLSRSDEKFREESYEGLRDNLQDYLGRLDREQRAVLERASADLKRSDRVWLEERAAWIDRLATLLQREPGWQEGIRRAIAMRDETVSREYVETYSHNLAVIEQAIATVVNSRTERQDRRLRRELTDLREDLLVLIEQGERRAAAEAA